MTAATAFANPFAGSGLTDSSRFHAERSLGGPWGDGWALFSPVWGASAGAAQVAPYRYALTRQWDPALPWTAFVMLNPSTADAFEVDPTVRRCLGYAKDWGSGGLLVLNAFALRSTEPEALYGHGAPVGVDNDYAIMEALTALQPAQVVAGWGPHAAKIDDTGAKRPRLGARLTVGRAAHIAWVSRATQMRHLLGDRLMALKVTKDGHPGHPLYLKGDLRPLPWSPR